MKYFEVELENPDEFLKLQTEDLSLRESFERFVGIFFPKN